MQKTVYSKKNIKIALIGASSIKEVLINLGIRAAGANYKTINKYLKKYEIDVSYFYNKKISIERKPKIKRPLSEVLVENSSYSRTSLKTRLFTEGLLQNKCELCGQDENWNGKKMALILDHINGVFNDNRINNLRIVCPNCEGTLDTHAGKNNKKESIRCCDCNKIINRKSKRCSKCHFNNRKEIVSEIKKGNKIVYKISQKINRRKVVRPDYHTLLNEIQTLGYCATGRKYGVSDNAIRKWIKNYQLNLAAWCNVDTPLSESDG